MSEKFISVTMLQFSNSIQIMKNHLHFSSINFSSSSSSSQIYTFFARLYTKKNVKDIIPEAQSLIKYCRFLLLTSSSAQILGSASASSQSAPQSNFTVGGLDPSGKKYFTKIKITWSSLRFWGLEK